MENKKPGNYQLVLFDEHTGEIKFNTDTDKLSSMLIWKEKYKRDKQLKSVNKFLTEYFGEKVMVFQNVLKQASMELNFEELRMLTYLFSICDFENWIHISQKEIAAELNTQFPNVSRAIKGLSKKGYVEVIKKNRTNYYRIRPEVAWKGSLENWKKVVELKPRKK